MYIDFTMHCTIPAAVNDITQSNPTKFEMKPVKHTTLVKHKDVSKWAESADVLGA